MAFVRIFVEMVLVGLWMSREGLGDVQRVHR